MLMYGDSLNIVDNARVFNLTSMKEGFERLPGLIPPNELGRFTGRDFDIIYANYIMDNDFVFYQFFQIINTLYIGQDVYIIVSSDDWSENLIESILKLIQQRYGYNGLRINCFEDYITFQNSNIDSKFNQYYGIQNLDIDKDRFAYISELIKMKSGNMGQ